LNFGFASGDPISWPTFYGLMRPPGTEIGQPLNGKNCDSRVSDQRGPAHPERVHGIADGRARQAIGPSRQDSCAFSKHYPPENYVIGAISDSLKLMAGWVLRWLFAVRTRFHQRLDLFLEFIVLRHQLAVQRTGTRRPRFRPSDQLF